MYGCKKWHSISEAKCKYCGRTFVPGVEHAVTAANELGLETKSIRDACRTGNAYSGYTWAYDL